MTGPLKLEDLQSSDDLFAPLAKQAAQAAPQNEQRRSERKTVDMPGHISLDGMSLEIRTVDLSLGGLSLRAERLLGVGKEGHVSFTLNEAHTVAASVRIVYCFFTQDGDFRAGLEFLAISNGQEALAEFLQA